MYRSAARMLWSIYTRRGTQVTGPQRWAIFSAWREMIMAARTFNIL